MKTLYYTTCSYFYPGIGVVLNQVLEDIKNGDEVYWAHCNHALSDCHFSKGQKLQCAFCQYGYKQLKGYLSSKVNFTEISRRNKEYEIPRFANFDDIKRFQYRDVKIGYGVLSSYISRTRDNDSDAISSLLQTFIDTIMPELCSCTDKFYELVEDIQPDHIKIYNGRLHENRFVYDICQSLNIGFSSLEVSGGFNEPYYPMEYKGALPHSVSLNTQMIHDTWNLSLEPENEKVDRSREFYIKRRNGISAGDKVYVANQVRGLLPESYDNSKETIVIFNSSADEISALGEDWEESTRLFKTQYDACRFIMSNVSPRVQVFLRIHPNLKGVKFRYHSDLYKLEQEFVNIKVIAPEDTISSYALLDIADKVVTFGSTMGIEASYWGKPSIMIGMSFYKMLDVTYNPQTLDVLKRLLNNSSLSPLNSFNTLKYAYFLMDRKYSVTQISNININPISVGRGRWTVQLFKPLKLWGSNILFGIIRFILIHIYRKK